MKIIADSHIPFIKEYFSSYGELILKPGRLISNNDLIDAELLLVRSITQVNQALLKNTSVKFVGSITSGTDHIDKKYLDAAKIDWCAAAGFNAASVADYVVSCIAGLQKRGKLLEPTIKTAVIGVGKVGSLVAERFATLGFAVQLCDPIRALHEETFPSTSLEQLEDLDLITLHVPLTCGRKNSTYHFINAEFLKKQKPGCILLNASRGAVIKTSELLSHGKHLDWCFDVWEHEPKISKDVLMQTKIATPHIAGYSIQSKLRGIDMIYKTAVAKKLIDSLTLPPVPFQYHMVDIHQATCWQDIALEVFDPLALTQKMQSQLLKNDVQGNVFDEMRHDFIARHEFAFTKIKAQHLPMREQKILQALKFIL